MSSLSDALAIEAIRREFPALRRYTWFQNGGVSLTPRCVADEHASRMRELLERGPMHIVYPDEEYPRRRATMERLAAFFDVGPSDLALMRGVSEAYQTVLRGLSWAPGDEIVISEDEEAALLLPTLHLRDRCGVRVLKFPLCEGIAAQQTAVEQCLSPRTRLVAFSHVTTDLGWRLPLDALAGTVRRHGALSFVDLAHSAGVVPIHLAASGCDFAGILSYKWMYGPYAAGLLYVRPDSRERLAVAYAGGRSEGSLDFENDRYTLREDAGRFQYGPWDWALIHAWAEAAGWLRDIGLSRIESRTAELAVRLKDHLAKIPRVTLLTPRAASQSAALVAFSVAGWTGESLSATLRNRWQMIVKPLPHTREGLRISLPFFTLEEEVDRLAEAVGMLAAAQPAF